MDNLNQIPILKKGGIHIKKENIGSFTRYCGGNVTQECIERGKNSPSAVIRKKSVFAANARRWKHESGGILKAQEGTGNLYAPHPLSPVGIALNQAKAMAKMKGEQHLPPGVKEVVGPDGKKVAIRTEQPLVPLEQSIAEWLPGTGDVAEVGYIANDVKNGNLGSAALAAVLMVLPGNTRKIFSKSRIDPIFINGEINQAGIQEGLFGGKRSAESFMGSQTYKDAVAHDIALAKRAFGYDINPVVNDRYIKMPVKIEGASLGPHDAGLMYSNPNTNNPIDDRILVDVGKHKTVNDLAATIFHENLHHGRFKTIDPQGNTIFTEIYHPEKVNPTLDFYKWKLKHLFKPEVEIPQELLDHYKYLTSVEIPHNEGATNVLELGFLGNARAKSGYPGAQEVQKLLDEVRKANPQHAYTIDLLNMKKPKRVWEAMTGQYEDGGKLTDNDYQERIKKFLLWRTISPEESTYIKNFKM